MSVTYKNKNTGDVVTLAAKSARLEGLSNWERVSGTASAETSEVQSPPPVESPSGIDELPDLSKLSRPDLNTLAADLGVEGAEDFKNAGEVRSAIEEAHAAKVAEANAGG